MCPSISARAVAPYLAVFAFIESTLAVSAILGMPSPPDSEPIAEANSGALTSEIYPDSMDLKKEEPPQHTSILSVVEEDDDDDDEEIEELVRTSFRKFQSQSAHANLSQMVCSFLVLRELQLQVCRYANMHRLPPH